MSKLILVLALVFSSYVNAGNGDSKKTYENKKTPGEKPNRGDLDSLIANFAAKYSCKPVTKNEYSPFLIKELFNDIGSHSKSALLYCRKNESLGILIYIEKSIKSPITKCPRYIPDVPENKNMGLDFRNNTIFSGLSEGGSFYSCVNGKWEEGTSH